MTSKLSYFAAACIMFIDAASALNLKKENNQLESVTAAETAKYSKGDRMAVLEARRAKRKAAGGAPSLLATVASECKMPPRPNMLPATCPPTTPGCQCLTELFLPATYVGQCDGSGDERICLDEDVSGVCPVTLLVGWDENDTCQDSFPNACLGLDSDSGPCQGYQPCKVFPKTSMGCCIEGFDDSTCSDVFPGCLGTDLTVNYPICDCSKLNPADPITVPTVTAAAPDFTVNSTFTPIEDEAADESAPEVVVEAAPEPTPEAVVEPTPEVVVEPTPEAVVEPTPEVVVEPTPEPVVEPIVEPVTETTDEVILESGGISDDVVVPEGGDADLFAPPSDLGGFEFA